MGELTLEYHLSRKKDELLQWKQQRNTRKLSISRMLWMMLLQRSQINSPLWMGYALRATFICVVCNYHLGHWWLEETSYFIFWRNSCSHQPKKRRTATTNWYPLSYCEYVYVHTLSSTLTCWIGTTLKDNEKAIAKNVQLCNHVISSTMTTYSMDPENAISMLRVCYCEVFFYQIS